MTKLKGFLTGMLASGAMVLTAGCNDNRDTGAISSRTAEGTSEAPAAAVAEEREVALVRVVNAIPAGAVTILAGDSSAFAGVSYKSATEFREIPDDRFNFKLGSAEDPLAENREILNSGGHYTIIAMPDEGGADKRNLRVLEDDLEPASADKARVRVINAIPGDLEISVYVRGREEPLFEGINFKSEAGWDQIDPLAGTVEVRPEGKTSVLARLPDMKFEGGKSYTFVVAGTPAKAEIIKIEDQVAPEMSSR
ncbi:MAG: DUF4397 domain-containing protein [Gemmatimonadales bacterium]